MFKKRSKKALSHVDWVMSLAVFLMYLVWFFVFVKPMIGPSQDMEVLLNILEEGSENYFFQDVQRIQVKITESYTNEYEPIIINFDESWTSANIAHTADHFVIDEGKMFFLANTTNASTFKIYYPLGVLTFSPELSISADEESARVRDFSAFFENYLLDYIFFDGSKKLFDLGVEVDEEALDEGGIFENNTFLVQYKREANGINISSYLFAENSRICTFIESDDYRNHSIVIDFAAYNYTNYYFTPLSNGRLSYSSQSCRYYESDFLDLYDSNSGLLITFDKNISMRLCTNETNSAVRLEFELYSGTENEFNIMLHYGDYKEVKEYPLQPITGVTETLTTISTEKAAWLKNRNYDYLKQIFNYPKDRDFNITLTSDTLTTSYGVTPPEVVDVYARKIEGFIIGNDYTTEKATLALTVW
jgi:hypothetical protein